MARASAALVTGSPPRSRPARSRAPGSARGRGRAAPPGCARAPRGGGGARRRRSARRSRPACAASGARPRASAVARSAARRRTTRAIRRCPARTLPQSAVGRRPDLPRPLVQRRALAAQRPLGAAGERGEVAGPAGDRGLAARRRIAPLRRIDRRASAQSSGTASSAAWVGVEQQTAATSSIRVESRWCPTALITGTRSIATVRQSVSSQNAQRSARLPPPLETTIASTSSIRGEVADRRGDRRRRPAVLDRGEGPDDRPPPSPPLQSGQQVLAGGAPLRRDHADRLRQQRPRQPPSAARTGPRTRACGAAPPAAPSGRPPRPRWTWVARKLEAGRGLGAAGVVVGTAPDHDRDPVAQRPLGQARAFRGRMSQIEQLTAPSPSRRSK